MQMHMQRHVGHTNIRLEVCQEAYTLQVRSIIHVLRLLTAASEAHVSAYQSRHIIAHGIPPLSLTMLSAAAVAMVLY
jgi:hypothetical protein